jgi:hypothetical protein
MKKKTATKPVTKQNWCIVRSDRAGVFFGDVVSVTDGVAEINQCRRLWYWSGASSISEIAIRGVSRPAECRFPVAVPSQSVYGVIEVIPCTDAAVKSLMGVPEWTQH